MLNINADVLSIAETQIRSNLEQLVVRQKLTSGEAKAVIDNIEFSNSISACKADLIIEAALEDLEVGIDTIKRRREGLLKFVET